MANSERYHVNLVAGKGAPSKKAHKSGPAMGKRKSAKGLKAVKKSAPPKAKPSKGKKP